MAREVENIKQYQVDEPLRMSKEVTVIRCDDGATYQFEQADGRPRPRFVRSYDPDGTPRNMTGRKMLAQSVEEVINTMFDDWDK